MTIKNIDTIIFDLGGVLIDWNPEYVFRQVFEQEEEMHYFLSEVCSPEWNIQQDAGRPLAEATEILVGQFPHYEAEIRTYYQHWQDMLGGAISSTVQLLEKLHRQSSHRLYALTNWSGETFPVALELFPFLQIFEGIVVSGDEKLSKPDLRIYELLLIRFQINAATALFIDDNKKNVAAARDAGMQAIHFHSAKQLEKQLGEIGVL